MAGGLVTVVDFEGPSGGNFVPAQMRACAAARAALDLELHLVAPEEARGTPWVADVERAGMAVSFIRRTMRADRLVKQIRTTLRNTSARIVHSHYTHFDIHCALAGRPEDVKVVWHVRNGLWGSRFRQQFKDLFKVRAAGRLCDCVVANSEQTYRESLARGFPANKVELILNGLVFDRLCPAWEYREAARHELRVPADAFVVLAFGWDPERKGVDLILRASEALSEQSPGRNLLVVVTGGEALEAAVSAYFDGRPRPEWLRLQAPVETVRTVYAAADVFVSASREDAFSFGIGEAMGSGLPVISSRISGPSHYFPSPGVITFPSDDWPALAAAIDRIARNNDRRDLGEANRRFVKRFSVERYAQRHVEVYDRLLSGRPRPRASSAT